MSPTTLMTHKYYPWLAETYNNHKSSFHNEQQKDSTELSKYFWSLINENKTQIINWKIINIIYSKVNPDFCKLCLMAKFCILNAAVDERCLNKKSEFITKCHHQINKLLLKNVKDSMDSN